LSNAEDLHTLMTSLALCKQSRSKRSSALWRQMWQNHRILQEMEVEADCA